MRPIVRACSALLLAPLVALPVSSVKPAIAADLDPAAATAPAGTAADGAQPSPAPTVLHASSLPSAGRVPLTLQEAIELGLRKNLAVEIARFDPAVADQQVREAWGAFDPLFAGNFGYLSSQTPNANAILGVTNLEQQITSGDLGLTGLIPNWGAAYDIGYAGDRLRTNSTVSALSPELSSSLVGTLAVPLLRGFLYGPADTALRVSRLGVDTANETFRTALMDVVQTIENAYWQVIASSEQRRVAEKSLETAKKLLDQVQTQYEVGVVSKVDVVEAEAGVYQREYDLIVAKTTYRQAQDNLIALIYGQEFRAADQVEIDPLDQPEGDIVYDTDLDVIMAKANVKRPELAAAQKNVEIRDVQLTAAKNQRLPQVDVVGTYGYAGLVGSPNPNFNTFFTGGRPIPNLGRNFWDTNSEYFGADGSRTWGAQGVVSIPILNEAARSRVSQGELELRRAKTGTLRIEQQIVLEVRQAVRNLAAAKEGIQAAESRQRASTEQLRAETIRQEQGESTPFDVLLRERDLVEAEAQKIEAQRIYRTSATNLDRAQGTILETHRIEVENQLLLR